MQLDLGQLRVRNEFSWHGSREKDPSAVHLDILYAEVFVFVSSGGSDIKHELVENFDSCCNVADFGNQHGSRNQWLYW